MTDSIKTFIYYISAQINSMPEIKNILEIGSLAAANQIEFSNLRAFFTNKNYIGIDQYPGPGVDKIMDAENLKGIDNGSIDLVLCLETIEHSEHPRQISSQIFDKLNEKHGIVIYSTPLNAPVHMEEDYWRVTPRGMQKILLYGFPNVEVYIQGEDTFPHTIIGIAAKKGLKFKIELEKLNNMLPWPYPYPFKKIF